MVFRPHVAAAFLKSIGIMGIIVLGIMLGFFLDGLRLYRLIRTQHSNFRNDFFKQLQNTIASNLNPYFILSSISDIADNKKNTGISLHHAIWIMLGHFTVLTFLETFFWVLAFCHLYFFSNPVYLLFNIVISRINALAICIGFSCLFFAIGCRFLDIYIEDQNKTNLMYLDFAKQHRDEIRQFLHITTDIK